MSPSLPGMTRGRIVNGSPPATTILLLALSILSGCSPGDNPYRLTLENRSEEPIQTLTLYVGNTPIEVGKLSSGEQRMEEFHIKRKGAISYRFERADGTCVTGLVDRKVMPGKGGNRRLIISEDGKVLVEDAEGRELPTLQGNESKEWALPCMIPG